MALLWICSWFSQRASRMPMTRPYSDALFMILCYSYLHLLLWKNVSHQPCQLPVAKLSKNVSILTRKTHRRVQLEHFLNISFHSRSPMTFQFNYFHYKTVYMFPSRPPCSILTALSTSQNQSPSSEFPPPPPPLAPLSIRVTAETNGWGSGLKQVFPSQFY